MRKAAVRKWEERPLTGWYRKNESDKTHYWNGTVTLCGKSWHGWKWRQPSHHPCKDCRIMYLERSSGYSYGAPLGIPFPKLYSP